MSFSLPGRFRRQLRLRRVAIGKTFVTALQILIIFIISSSDFGEFINSTQLQFFSYLRGTIDPPKDILIAAIDEDSFIEENISGLNSWPRELFAEALENIRDAGARIAVIDILIDPTSTFEKSDKRYIEVFKDFPSSIAMFEHITSYKDLNGVLKFKKNISKPKQEFIDAAKFLTPMMVRIDADGKVKHFYFSKRYVEEGKSPIPLAEIVAFFKNKKISKIPSLNEYINYYGPSGSITTVSINEFLDKNINAKLKAKIKDKIIVVGTFREVQAETKSEDQFNTNFGNIFGAEIHATVIGNLIDGNWIKKLNPKQELIIICSLTIFCSFLSIGAGPIWGCLISISSALILVLVSYQLFLKYYFFPCFIYSFLIVPLLIIGILAFHYFSTLKAFKQVEEALGVSLRPKK